MSSDLGVAYVLEGPLWQTLGDDKRWRCWKRTNAGYDGGVGYDSPRYRTLCSSASHGRLPFLG